MKKRLGVKHIVIWINGFRCRDIMPSPHLIEYICLKADGGLKSATGASLISPRKYTAINIPNGAGNPA